LFAVQLLQVPLSQRPEQQSASCMQVPDCLQAHFALPPHAPLQQSAAAPHASPTAAQAHLPSWPQVLLQQSALLMQSPPTALQAQWPASQRSVQQSPFLVQVAPPAVQSHTPNSEALQLPLQQSLACWQRPFGAPQQAPSRQTWPCMQLVEVQPLPLGTQLWPDFMKPLLQLKSQMPPLQVAVPFAGAGQGSQLEPHDCGLALARQSEPQV
jgi:hypothetical protein